MKAAGKTGTTSESKDSWFAGSTPFHTTIVWVGYDQNQNHGLTGSTGALPIWIDYNENNYEHHSTELPTDFLWPDTLKKTEIKSLDERENSILYLP